MESIFDEFDKQTIAAQNFSKAIFWCIAYSVISYFLCFYRHNELIFIINTGIGNYLLTFFRKYLRNFKSSRSIFWVGCQIVINYAIIVATILNIYLSTENISHVSVFYLWMFLLLAGLYVQIRMGLAYQKINDFIGLLHPLGIISAYLIPLGVICGVALNYPTFEKMMNNTQLTLVYLFLNTINNIPNVLIILIFYRAMKYRQNIVEPSSS